MCAELSPGQVRSQCELASQASEQDAAVHVTWQVALLPQDTELDLPMERVHVDCSQSMLPLSPVVRLQLLPALQAALQEPPHIPLQVLLLTHASEQLPPLASQPAAGQLQVAPL